MYPKVKFYCVIFLAVIVFLLICVAGVHALVDDSNTKSLLHFNEANGTKVPVDESGKVWTTIQTAYVSDIVPKFGAGSMYFGSTNSNTSTPLTSDFLVDSGDVTIDFWYNTSSVAAAYQYAFEAGSVDDSLRYGLVLASGAWKGFDGLGFKCTESTKHTTVNTWQHVALVKNGTNVKIYVDGNFVCSDTWSPFSTPSGRVTLGNYHGGGYQWLGRIDEFRYSNGTSRWTGNFTPPTSPYSAAPVASFTVNATTGAAPLSVLFTDTSTKSPTSWSYGAKNFTPGNNTWFQFSTLQNPTYTFGVGNWSVNLTATNAGGSDISTQTTWINVSRSNLFVITHGFGTTPTYVIVRGTVPNEILAVTAKDATTFTVSITKPNGLAGTNQVIYWMVG